MALKYSLVHKKAYNFLVCEFEGFESVFRGWGRTGHPIIASTDVIVEAACCEVVRAGGDEKQVINFAWPDSKEL